MNGSIEQKLCNQFSSKICNLGCSIPMAKPQFVSLFAGCGGMDLGFVQAGFEPVAAYDNWDSAVENYKRNIGGHAEVLDLSVARLPISVKKCDVVIAGSPTART